MDNGELSFIKGMFDNIASKYDLLNKILSLRRDVYWRSKMVAEVKNYSKSKINVLDIACGTGDVAIEFINQKGNSVNVVGIDFSEKMLIKAQDKIKKMSFRNINLVNANALSLPFTAESFDIITIAFGIRNIKNRISALRDFYSLLKPKGTLLVLELSLPQKNIISKIFMYYFTNILPKIGKIFSKNSFAYTYLPSSVLNFPSANEFASIMVDAGFSQVSYKNFTMGIVNLFAGHKN